MNVLFYEDNIPKNLSTSIFLAGPTTRIAHRTPWRASALQSLENLKFDGTVIVPEFREPVDEKQPGYTRDPGGLRFEQRFGGGDCPVPSMKVSSYNILHWETTGIEAATVVLFWMPFTLLDDDDPASLPGFTTRAEVSRELVRDPLRCVLGMTNDALSGSHIRYHAHNAGVRIATNLDETVKRAFNQACKVRKPGPQGGPDVFVKADGKCGVCGTLYSQTFCGPYNCQFQS